MKKISTSLAVFCIFVGLNLDAATQTEVDTVLVGDKQENINNVKMPKKANMSELLNEAILELKSKNPKAKIYSGIAGVDASPDDIEYYDYLTSAYNQAILDLKAQYVLKKSGTASFNEVFNYFNNKSPDSKRFDDIKAKAKKELEKTDSTDGIFGIVNTLINELLHQNNKKVADEKQVIQVSQDIFNKAFNESFIKQAFDDIKGLIPYETFIITDENGQTQIGVLAYTTPRSIALANDLSHGKASKQTTNKSRCKSAVQMANELQSKDLLNKFGLQYFYNENCRPSLLAFGMDSYQKEDGMNADYQSESTQRSRAMADKFISNFLNSNVNALIKDNKLANKTKKVMIEASIQNGRTDFSAPSKKSSTNIVKTMAKDFSSNSSMNLIGLEDARIWSEDMGDYVVVGTIRYYSLDSINSARDEFKSIQSDIDKKQKTHIKNDVKHSMNLDVEDF